MRDRTKTDLLSIARGTVTAPAGCGKTQLIADTVFNHSGDKPILVLTHTNAGVAALRRRLRLARVPTSHFRLSTIDGWAMRLIRTFPMRSAHDPDILELSKPSTDYPSIRSAAVRLLSEGHIGDIISASYAHLIVDEYQDCIDAQHVITSCVAEYVPTCVLGDPMQAIFGFGGSRLPDWDNEVCGYFPVTEELKEPWRWINSGTPELGEWLLDMRRSLLHGTAIDLSTAPRCVQWVELDGTNDRQSQLVAARVLPPGGNGSVLIIGFSTSPPAQRRIASEIPGAVTVESVELRDLIEFARDFDLESPDALEKLAAFAQKVMTNVGAGDLVRRVEILAHETARRPPSGAEAAALSFAETPSEAAAIDVLVAINREPGVRLYRPAVLRACKKALGLCQGSDGTTFHEAAIRMREENRFYGRPMPRRAVGSTLLLKGLEADAAVVLDADTLNSRNLYVAATRGSRALTICSKSRILSPR